MKTSVWERKCLRQAAERKFQSHFPGICTCQAQKPDLITYAVIELALAPVEVSKLLSIIIIPIKHPEISTMLEAPSLIYKKHSLKKFDSHELRLSIPQETEKRCAVQA